MMYVRLRPIASAMTPKLTYPNHIPTCIAITKSDIVDEERPMPPLSGGSLRYVGIQPFMPHHAKRQNEFMRMMAIVIGAMPGPNTALTRPRSAGAADCQIVGSSIFR